MARTKKSPTSEKTRVKKKEGKLKVLIVAAEVAPYASVGGVAFVMKHLSKALTDLGYDVRVFMPKFGSIDETINKISMEYEGLEVPTGDEMGTKLICNVKKVSNENGFTTYFLENQEYYEKRANVYGYSDDPTRWALLARGTLEFIRTGIFVPDVIHCNDWHTGLLPNYVKTVYRKDPILGKIPMVFTIHNMMFQGMIDHRHMSELDYDDGRSHIPSFFADRLNKLNFLKRGILYSDALNTVSKTYAKEILTPEFGEGLDKLLMELKGRLFGIINGIDYDELNPATDTLVEKNYDIGSLELRDENKNALQKEYDLPIKPNVPLFGFVGRLDIQKGVDLLVRTLRQVLAEYNIQFVQVGGGDGGLAEMLNYLKNDFPDKVGIHPYPNFALPRMLFSGCDLFVYPSRFEPCGVVQLEAMRYGAIPVVRHVGGLADTVENFDSSTGKGTGFVFKYFNEFSLFGQMIRAMEVYNNTSLWRQLQENAMRQDFSWNFSASEYVKLYERAAHFRKKEIPTKK
ncbi:glycogen synthase [Patescibacteria group bacterium]|nr:glycogen synthase [Patescibacteria group bacterium]